MAVLAMGVAHVVYRGVLRPGTAPESAPESVPPLATGIAAPGMAAAGRIPAVTDAPDAPRTEARPGVPVQVAEAPPAPSDISGVLPGGWELKIAQLIEGALLLGEKAVEENGIRKTVRVYDIGDRFKYRRVRVETVVTPSGYEPSTAIVADHLIVKRNETKDEAAFEEMLDGRGLVVRKRMYTPGHYLVSVAGEAVPVVDLVEHLTDRLAGELVEIAAPDGLAFTTAVPNDPRFGELWGMHHTSAVVDVDIDAPEAWEQATGSSHIVVGVIDSGIDYNHPDLAANIWTNPGEIPGDGIDNDGNGLVDDIHGWDFANDDNDPIGQRGHGTHVAGILGAVGNNGIGVAGVNWNVRMAALQFINAQDVGSTPDAIDAIYYATRMGMHLTCNSWVVGLHYNPLLERVIKAAGDDAGQLFVAGAGNRFPGWNVDRPRAAHYPACFNLDNIISVAAVNSNATLSSFSNWGATSVDLAAPGEAILSTWPESKYVVRSGTSMATPHVAGACALFLSLGPPDYPFRFREVKAKVLATAERIPALQGRCVTGGRLNLHDLLRSAGNFDSVTGTVTLYGVDRPIEGVVVGIGRNTVHTGQDGRYTLRFTEPGTYAILAAKKNYLPETSTIAVSGPSSKLDFILTNPQIAASVRRINVDLAPGETYHGSFQLRNSGHGPLKWSTGRFLKHLTEEPVTFGRITSDTSGSMTNEPYQVKLSINAVGLSTGIYQDGIVIESNDAVGNNVLRIPVALHVRSRAYEDFIGRHRVPASSRGWWSDGDRDGIANLLEFAFGLDPNRASRAGIPSLTAVPSTNSLPVISLEYRRRTDASGLDYLIEGSDDLDTWSAMAPASESTLPTEDPSVEKVFSVMAPDPSKPAYFFRVRVE